MLVLPQWIRKRFPAVRLKKLYSIDKSLYSLYYRIKYSHAL
jgi:hypothetical protein